MLLWLYSHIFKHLNWLWTLAYSSWQVIDCWGFFKRFLLLAEIVWSTSFHVKLDCIAAVIVIVFFLSFKFFPCLVWQFVTCVSYRNQSQVMQIWGCVYLFFNNYTIILGEMQSLVFCMPFWMLCCSSDTVNLKTWLLMTEWKLRAIIAIVLRWRFVYVCVCVCVFFF
jgi:hypothetical protein